MEAVDSDHALECGIWLDEFSSDVNNDMVPLMLSCGHTFSRGGLAEVRPLGSS